MSIRKLWAFDIDGVVADTHSAMQHVIGCHCGVQFTTEKPLPYDAYKQGYNITKGELMSIFNTLILTDYVSPMKGAVDVLTSYYDETQRLIFITHRTNRAVVEKTRAWIANHFKRPYELYACYKCEKAEVAKGLGVTGFIDDLPEICEQFINKGLDTYLFDTPWHIYLNNLNGMPRVKDWEEVRQILEDK
jgi:uncharacterized HAD superfamily protein